MKKLILLLTALLLPIIGNAQTPCVEQAKLGIVGSCLQAQVPVTPADAKWVSMDAAVVPKYTVDPTVGGSIAFEFSTLEQAQALVALLNHAHPGSAFNIVDYSGNFVFPPFRRLAYFNAGDETSPRLYQINGTVNLPDGPVAITTFSAGWILNVKGLLFGGLTGKKLVITRDPVYGFYPTWTDAQ